MFEKILKWKITSNLSTSDKCPKLQSSYRNKYSCTTALLKITDDILHYIDKKELVFLILLDVTKAFDRIKHGLLLVILHFIRQLAVPLVVNYVDGRQEADIVDNKTSKFIYVISGVP